MRYDDFNVAEQVDVREWIIVVTMISSIVSLPFWLISLLKWVTDSLFAQTIGGEKWDQVEKRGQVAASMEHAHAHALDSNQDKGK